MGKTTVEPKGRQALQQSPFLVKCSNKAMPESIPDPPYYWDNSLKVRCIDWRFRYSNSVDEMCKSHLYIFYELKKVNVDFSTRRLYTINLFDRFLGLLERR